MHIPLELRPQSYPEGEKELGEREGRGGGWTVSTSTAGRWNEIQMRESRHLEREEEGEGRGKGGKGRDQKRQKGPLFIFVPSMDEDKRKSY